MISEEMRQAACKAITERGKGNNVTIPDINAMLEAAFSAPIQSQAVDGTNMFGKQPGRFDEHAARRAQRGLLDQFTGAFHTLDLTQRREALAKFHAAFSHPHCADKFLLSEITSTPATNQQA